MKTSLADSGMAEAACYPSNAFCGPIQGDMKMKSLIARRSKAATPSRRGMKFASQPRPANVALEDKPGLA